VSSASRGYYQGMINLLYGCGAGVGALVGGAIADSFGWRAAFWLQVLPIVMATFLILTGLVTDTAIASGRGCQLWKSVSGFDWWGLSILGVNVSAVCGQDLNGRSPVSQSPLRS
jgi:MFS family permease